MAKRGAGGGEDVRVAVDIGGTFTDLEFFDARSGRHGSLKVPTTPADPSEGLIAALTEAGRRFGFAPADIGLLIHGTTIATNAVLTRDLPAGALITTSGFEDVLEIGRHARRDVYGLKPEARPLLIPRRRRFGIIERIGPRGEVETPLDNASLEAVLDRVAASGATAVAVSLINAFANPTHELAVEAALRARLPALAVSCSHAVSPEIREFERTSTTVLNALLMPVLKRYVGALAARLAEAGVTAPVYLVQSNGGAATLAAAGEAPVKLLLSGPSGGVLAAERVAAALGIADVVGVDMGGTSYDVAIVRGGRRSVVSQSEIDGLPVRVPMVDMRTIGAGGGSMVRVDAGGRLRVGPESAGARPGPVCYRHGGTEPTVTDVNLILGRLAPDSFLMDGKPLDIDGAREAFRARVADPLGLSVEAAAEGVLQVVTAKLAGAIKLSLFERGLDPRDFALMSFGGAGGLHAVPVAEELGMCRVIFPEGPSTFSAHGILQSDIVHDLAATAILPLEPASLARIRGLIAGLASEGDRLLAADGLEPANRHLAFSADLRYRGQAFELAVPLPAGDFDGAALAALAEAFHRLHVERFSFDDRAERIELVTLRANAIGRLSKAAGGRAVASAASGGGARRAVYLDGRWQDVPVIAQASLTPGLSLAGPAIIEQALTSLLLPEGWRLEAAPGGDLLARKEAP